MSNVIACLINLKPPLTLSQTDRESRLSSHHRKKKNNKKNIQNVDVIFVLICLWFFHTLTIMPLNCNIIFIIIILSMFAVGIYHKSCESLFVSRHEFIKKKKNEGDNIKSIHIVIFSLHLPHFQFNSTDMTTLNCANNLKFGIWSTQQQENEEEKIE